VLIPKVFNIFTVAVKFASCALCVASGLPVGPEGPMIHMGAAIGAALSQGHSTTLGFTTNIFRRFRNPRDKRDFVTAGVAVGVATAFNAPIGGLLFAFEEVASFWKHSLTWQVRGQCVDTMVELGLQLNTES
jgi:chloride channel 7